MKLRAMIRICCEHENRDDVWIDYNIDGWSEQTAIRRLNEGIKEGNWSAWRLIRIQQQSSN